MKNYLLIFFVSFFLFNAVSAKSDHDWDWMDCHHGYYVSPQNSTGNDHCECNSGWRGTECSLCASSTVCNKGEICDKTLIIEKEKAFNCTVMGSGIIPPGAVDSIWNFTAGNGYGFGVVDVYLHPTGAPFLFNCSFTKCSKSIEVSSNTMTVTCGETSCRCSTWCSTFLLNLINQMHTTAHFTCDLKTSACNIQQKELPIVINLQCDAAACQEGPYIPPTHQFSFISLFLLFGSAIATLLLLLSTSCYIFNFIKHRYTKLPTTSPVLFSEQIQLTLSWSNLSCKIKNRVVLNGITGIAKPGEITAILGPSGAGKTTFIDMLAGRKNTGIVTGDILVNGVHKDKTWKRITAYVMQDDRQIGTLTVEEHLITIAELKLPSTLSFNEKYMRVMEVMEELNISHIAHSRIGTSTSRGISGGERRRLSIASELITDPRILFLDEPTSGLDSYTAYSLLETLRKLAISKKCTVIISIHQPRSNIYQLFDKLLLLSHGLTIYFGPSSDAVNYFKSIGFDCPVNFNPADFVIDLVTMNNRDFVVDLALKYKQSKYSSIWSNVVNSISNNNNSSIVTINNNGNINNNIEDKDNYINNNKEEEEIDNYNNNNNNDNNIEREEEEYNINGVELTEEYKQEYATNVIKQIWVLSKRTIRNNIRNPYLIRVQYSIVIVLALLIGGIYFKSTSDLVGAQNRSGALFFMIALLSFASISSIDTFFEERPIFLRERANGMYRTSSYFIAKTICDVLPMRIIPPLLLGSISYYMIQLNPPIQNFLWFLLALVLVSLVAGAMSLMISSFVPSLGLGNLIAILLLLFYMLFGGFLLNKTSLPYAISWFKWVSFMEYAFEILMLNEFIGATILFDPKGETNVNVTIKGEVFLDQFDMQQSRFYWDFVVLAGMATFYLTGAYFLLRFAVKERR